MNLIKPFLPRSLFGRALMILVLPIVLLQAVVAAVFIQRHYDGVTGQMAASIARELNFAIIEVEQADSDEHAAEILGNMAAPLGIEFGLAVDERVEVEAMRAFYDVTGGVIAETLKAQVRHPMALDLVSYQKHVDVQIATSKGVLRALVPRRRMNAANPHLLFVWMGCTALLLTGIATVFLRNQVRPIRDLARAASAYGRGRSVDFRAAGAEEVRHAGKAFLDMRTRIDRHVEQRTRMLSGVSHDLRTPLTRIKLALAVADDVPELSEISRDVVEMERMLDGFLAFARGEGAEVAEACDAARLADEVASDARRKGGQVSVFSQIDTPDVPTVVLRRDAIKRCLTNLLDNATTYGTKAALSMRLTRRALEFSVEDDGPGIPVEAREDVLKPFTRLDESRNQNTAAGVGLGLSIAVDIVRGHGGTLTLGDSSRLGGLKATLVIPR